MKLKTYQAWTMAEALDFVKKDLGADAVILHTRTFERGGFFGLGRKTVVEITAAPASELKPSSKPRDGDRRRNDSQREREGRRSRREQRDASSAQSSSAPSVKPNAERADRPAATSAPVRDEVRLSAASRAYAGAGAATPPAQPPVARFTDAAPMPLPLGGMDMALEREKTRRLAMAMAVQLEKQITERAAAGEVEAATDRAARQHRRGERAASTAAPAAPGPLEAPQPSAAQRFVLVPEPAEPGVSRVTAAVVRAPEQDSRERAALLGPDRAEARPVAKAPEPRVTASPERAKPVAEPKPAIPVISRFVEDEEELAASAGVDAGVDAAPLEARVAPVPAREPAQVAARLPAAAAPEPVPSRKGDLDVISAFVGRVLERGDAPSSGPRPAALETAYARLIEQEVARELADRILEDVARELHEAAESGTETSDAEVRAAVERRIARLLPEIDADAAYRVLPGRHGARRIAFVGPTGVGKTTTLAKIAAQLKLKKGLRVGIVAADTYRIAAVDQLRTYAEILGLPVEVAASPADAERACERLGELDCILIDTAGRSQNDRMKLGELRAFLTAAAPDETHLVLSATASTKTLLREADAFCALGVDRVVFTKLDEAASFGTLVTLVERLGKQISYLTHGQEVPDHIEPARVQRLASLVMGSEVR
ncbi:MAG: hypothetical protein ACKO0W_12100 [Planctomycetota bacterium]